MTTDDKLRRYQRNYADERDSAALYAAMAATDPDSRHAVLYHRLSEEEASHAAFWRARLEEASGRPADTRLSWRARTLIWLTRRFGPGLVLNMVRRDEIDNREIYDEQQEASGTPLARQERSHVRLLSRLASDAPRQWDGSRYALLEGRHGAGGGNALRAAVLGANDGLVSTLSLVMGAAGAAFAPAALLLTALAGMLAGACSMAMGEWISVQSSRELILRQIAVEADELEHLPAEEEEELRLIYQAKGLSDADAHRLAASVIGNKASALDTLAREELGVNPEDLGGSAWVAAATSFAVFCVGALPPVVPLLLFTGPLAIGTSLAASALALFLIGLGISLFTGSPPLRTGLRQLIIGALAAAVTYGAGSGVSAWVG